MPSKLYIDRSSPQWENLHSLPRNDLAYELYTKNNHEADVALVMQSTQYFYIVKTVTYQFSDERNSVCFNRTMA